VYKEVFSTKAGQMILNDLAIFCLASHHKNMACPASTNQTFYNLGAYAVYRHIHYLIQLESGQPAEDCIDTENENTGE
jgi:hypothetical protein